MLNPNTIDSVQLLANMFANNGHRLTVVDESPLSKLCRDCETPVTDMISVGIVQPSMEEIATTLHEASAEPLPLAGAGSDHDSTLAAFAAAAAETIRNNILIARTVVNPVISAGVEHITSVINGDATVATLPTIEPCRFENIWLSPLFGTFVLDTPYNTTFKTPCPKYLKPMDMEQIKTYMKTGSSTVDRELEKWYEEISDVEILKTFNLVFEFSEGVGSACDDVRAVVTDHYVHRNRALLSFLMARGFLANIDEIQIEERRGVVSKLLQDTMEICIVTLKNLQHRKTVDESAESIILQWPGGTNETNSVLVHSQLYSEWLSEGGKPEAILGAAVLPKFGQGNRHHTKLDLTENHDQYVNAWAAHLAKMGSVIQNNKLANYRKGLFDVCMEHINASVSGDMVFSARQDYVTRVYEYIKEFTMLRDLEDLHGAVKRAVCTIFYSHTYADRILDSINSICDEYPDLDPKEAATIAITNFTTDWVCKMVKVKACGNAV